MPRWNLQAVEKAAPDASSLTAARKLAVPGPWSETGSTDTLVWGQCQGSGRTPYQVSIDLAGPAYRCSCPSRKFPCKHALALLLLWVRSDGAVADAAEPAGFAGDWAATRAERAAGAAATEAKRPVDPEARARRVEERRSTMSAALEDFAQWLADLARSGTASARRQPWTWWDTA
ncbi:SWIM zinc finger domain-containing protein, partial [Nocardioides kongjuensis]